MLIWSVKKVTIIQNKAVTEMITNWEAGELFFLLYPINSDLKETNILLLMCL